MIISHENDLAKKQQKQKTFGYFFTDSMNKVKVKEIKFHIFL